MYYRNLKGRKSSLDQWFSHRVHMVPGGSIADFFGGNLHKQNSKLGVHNSILVVNEKILLEMYYCFFFILHRL